MATSNTVTITKQDGWVEITAASGLSGTVQNKSALMSCYYAETVSGEPGELVEGMKLAPLAAFPKASTETAWVRASTGTVKVDFTEWQNDEVA